MTHCRVFLLDESEIEIGLNIHAEGKELLESVCKYLNLVETDYFGLAVKDEASSNKVWVRLDKTIKKQFPTYPSSWTFYFAVKYYPTDPYYLKEEITKYQLCLQIRDDLMCGRLPCPLETLAILSSYWLQSEFGDHKEDSMKVNRYLASFKYISQSDKSIPGFEDKIRKLYLSRRGMPPCDADTQFLRLAKSLPLYGLHRYVTKGKDDSEKILGVGSGGIFEISDEDHPLKYKWGTIKNINYKKEKFYVKLLRSSPEGHSTKHTYKLTSSHIAKALWRDAVDQHVFFRVTGSDSTSSGTTPNAAPETDRGKSLSKKEKRGFRFSSRKNRHKTEVQVRAQSAKINRPNPTVIRHSGLQRSASSSSSHTSVKSDSFESNTSSSSEENKKAKHKRSSSPLRSILKNKKLLKEKPTIRALEEHEDSDDEGRPFTNDDFVDDDEDPKDVSHGTCSLLLTETILEEDEDADEPTKTPSDVKGQTQSISEDGDSHTCPEITMKFQPILDVSECISQEEARNKELVCPIVTVEMCPESNSRKVSLELNQENETNLLSPPLVRKLTREAIVPYVAESKSSDEKNKINSPFENIKQDIRPKLDIIQDEGLSHRIEKCAKPNNVVLSPPAPEEIDSVPSSLEFSLNQNGARNDDEEEDDRKTLGTASAVAVFGDDDMTIKDLADDVTIGDLTEYSRGRSDVVDDDSQGDNESKITESSDTSISDLTDNTEELCSPNILEIIWSKCFRNREYGYREIFAVKLRNIKGRSRRVKSAAFDLDEHISVATQIPTPPISNDSAKTDISTKTTDNFTAFHDKTFIPSWPFDPDSLALNIDLDELDKEAMRAALHAQRDVQKEENRCQINLNLNDIKGTERNSNRTSRAENFSTKAENVSDRKESQKLYSYGPKLGEKTVEPKSGESAYLDGTSRFIIDSIPGIPLFNRSVLRSSGSTSLDESRCTSISSVSSKETLPKIPSEKLVYPPSIQTYQTNVQETPRVLVYQPNAISTSTSGEKENKSMRPQSKADDTKVDLVEDSTQTSNPIVRPQDLMKTCESSNSNFDEATQTLENFESGRSTPSSVSSFPSFVHSIFPLRKMSSTSESTTTYQRRRNETSHGTVKNDDSESISSLSECSVKSVRGSILEANQCEIEEMLLPQQDNKSGTQHTQITIIDFINENCPPDKLQSESVQVNVEILRVKDEAEIVQAAMNNDVGSISREADYAEDVIQASQESSIETNATVSLNEEAPHNLSLSKDALNGVQNNRKESTSSPEAWSTVTNVTTSDESPENYWDQTFPLDVTPGANDFMMDNLNTLPTFNNPPTDEENRFIDQPDDQPSEISETVEVFAIGDNIDRGDVVLGATIPLDSLRTAQCKGSNTDTTSLYENTEVVPQPTTSIDIVTVEDGSTNDEDTESETTDDGEFNIDEVQSPLDD